MRTPAHNEATVNINYGGQAHKSFLHRNICDVNAPDLISMVNIQAPEQVWFDVGCASKLAQMLAMAHWHYAHQAHHTTYFSQPYFVTLFHKKVGHIHCSLGWMIQMLGIDLLHHLQVLLALSFESIVDAGSVQS